MSPRKIIPLVVSFKGSSGVIPTFPTHQVLALAALAPLGFFHLLKNMCYFPLLVLKGVYHYWKYVLIFSRGRKSKWKASHRVNWWPFGKPSPFGPSRQKALAEAANWRAPLPGAMRSQAGRSMEGFHCTQKARSCFC